MALIIYPNGTEKEVQPKNGIDFQIDELNKIVDGYIEIVYLRKQNGTLVNLMVINEEGKLLNPPMQRNEVATHIAHEHFAINRTDYIAGPALICKPDEIK